MNISFLMALLGIIITSPLIGNCHHITFNYFMLCIIKTHIFIMQIRTLTKALCILLYCLNLKVFCVIKGIQSEKQYFPQGSKVISKLTESTFQLFL